MKKPIIIPQELFEATIQFVAENGLESITMKKVAVKLGISEGSIFYHFPNKQALLSESFFYIDRQIDTFLQAADLSASPQEQQIRCLWDTYFQFWITHAGYAKFYRNFRNSSLYSPNTMQKQSIAFAYFSQIAHKYAPLLGQNISIFWIYLIETTLNFAVYIEEGRLAKDEQTIDDIFQILAGGIYGTLERNARNVLV